VAKPNCFKVFIRTKDGAKDEPQTTRIAKARAYALYNFINREMDSEECDVIRVWIEGRNGAIVAENSVNR
jgi:hypothetical protein